MYTECLYHIKIYELLRGALAWTEISSQNSVADKWLTPDFFCSV